MNMEEQFQRFVDSQSGGGSDGFAYRAPQPPPSLHFSPSRLPQKGPWSRSLGLSISQQVYKYVKWITVVIVVGLIIYFLHSYTKKYLFPQPPTAPNCGIHERPLHPSGQPPLPEVELANEYENNQFLEEEKEETCAQPAPQHLKQQQKQQQPPQQPPQQPEEKDEKFTPLSELSDA